MEGAEAKYLLAQYYYDTKKDKEAAGAHRLHQQNAASVLLLARGFTRTLGYLHPSRRRFPGSSVSDQLAAELQS